MLEDSSCPFAFTTAIKSLCKQSYLYASLSAKRKSKLLTINQLVMSHPSFVHPFCIFNKLTDGPRINQIDSQFNFSLLISFHCAAHSLWPALSHRTPPSSPHMKTPWERLVSRLIWQPTTSAPVSYQNHIDMLLEKIWNSVKNVFF